MRNCAHHISDAYARCIDVPPPPALPPGGHPPSRLDGVGGVHRRVVTAEKIARAVDQVTSSPARLNHDDQRVTLNACMFSQ